MKVQIALPNHSLWEKICTCGSKDFIKTVPFFTRSKAIHLHNPSQYAFFQCTNCGQKSVNPKNEIYLV